MGVLAAKGPVVLERTSKAQTTFLRVNFDCELIKFEVERLTIGSSL